MTRHISVTQVKLLRSSSGDSGGDGDKKNPGWQGGSNRDGSDNPETSYPVHHSLPATVVVPEVWPHLPLIAISRNPVFPRFIKLVEVSRLPFTVITLRQLESV
uniref:Lon N-terminal domain-containing protein n=1 Tax=Timema genevievae TaxID=629358 RepID=A0A7R9PNN6_TIMGE|nr:unnamed protein product [Timema genevievae]